MRCRFRAGLGCMEASGLMVELLDLYEDRGSAPQRRLWKALTPKTPTHETIWPMKVQDVYGQSIVESTRLSRHEEDHIRKIAK